MSTPAQSDRGGSSPAEREAFDATTGYAPRRWRAGERVTRELYMDDGTWARLGDKCLPHSPLMHGVVIERDRRRADGVWVRWDFDGSMSMYLDHGLDAEEAHSR